jgi:hypothetical protein
MPALAPLSPTQPAAPVSRFHTSRWEDGPYAQGIEGRKISAKAEEVYRHWRERVEVLLMPRQETDEFSYEHVPPNRMFYIKTRYVYVGKGLPQPLDLDEE